VEHYLHGYEYKPPCSGPDRRGADVAAPPGSTRLVAAHSDKCVTIKGGLSVQEVPAYQVTCTRTAGAQWYFQRMEPPRPDGVTYQIRNTSTGMCLDSRISERRVSEASVVVQRPCVDDSLSQSWRFEATGRRADSTEGRFVNVEHKDCLNVNGGAVTDGAPIIRWQCENDPFQVSADGLGE
jgi:Ricin-type beta-trefoil lectin domain